MILKLLSFEDFIEIIGSLCETTQSSTSVILTTTPSTTATTTTTTSTTTMTTFSVSLTTNIVSCPTNVCLNGGLCSLTLTGVTCSCRPNFSGIICQNQQPFCEDPAVCRNGKYYNMILSNKIFF